MTLKSIKLENVLNKFSNIAEKEGLAIISSEGLVIVSKFKPECDADNVPEKIAGLASVARDLIERAGFSDLEQIFVEGKNRKILIHRNQSNGFSIILAGKEKMNMGMAKLAMKEAIQELDSVIDLKEKIPAEA